MRIAVINRSRLSQRAVGEAVRAVNRQIERDFTPHWGLGARLHLVRRGARPRPREAEVHLLHKPGPLGWHAWTSRGIPSGFVVTRMGDVLGEEADWLHWSVCLSHEVLELVADPQLNLLVKGRHPRLRREVFYYREICDPVQTMTYRIHGVPVCNFVLPHYYNAQGEAGGRNDFLDSGLKAFRWADGGYVGCWDPRAGGHGRYVIFPQLSPRHLSARVRRLKGPLARLHRYARSAARGPAR